MKTITVDQKGSGDFKKIQDALDNIESCADNVSQVVIFPGVYVECLNIINSNIELIGKKENINETIIENPIGEPQTVNIKSRNVKLKNLCIRQTHFSENSLKKSYALNLTGDFFAIEYCNIVSNQGGIFAFLSNNLNVRSCNINSRDECGIYLDEYGKIAIEYSNIQCINGSGISIFGQGSFKSQPQMIEIYKAFQEVKNTLDIVSIDKDCFPKINYNKINNCADGIFIDGGSCLIENNEIFNNTHGIFVLSGSPMIKNNKIFNNHTPINDMENNAVLENNIFNQT